MTWSKQAGQGRAGHSTANIDCGIEGFYPQIFWEPSGKQHEPDKFYQSSFHPFCNPILKGWIRRSQLMLNTNIFKMGSKMFRDILPPLSGLKTRSSVRCVSLPFFIVEV